MDTASTQNRAAAYFGAAMWAYVLSFVLLSATRGGFSVPGGFCAYVAFMALINPIVNSQFFEEKASSTVPFIIAGLINFAFLASLAMRWWEGNQLPFKVLRAITLLMIPSCWVVFFNESAYPHVGHVVWVVAMVVALFSQPKSRAASDTAWRERQPEQ